MVGKTLSEIAKALNCDPRTLGGASIRAEGVAVSSSDDCSGKVFVAVRGERHDGHDFVPEAIKKGAVAAVVESSAGLLDTPHILVPNSRRALSRLAALFHNEPSASMHIVGVTGTNGKTTTNWIVYNLLNSAGVPSMRLGTLGMEAHPAAGNAALSRKENLTTPDAVTLHADLHAGIKSGVKACVMEVSSHALVQSRVDDVQFDVAVFTNLTRDHLDFHKSMEDYFSAKRQLFQLLQQSPKAPKAAVINADTEYGQTLIQELKGASFDILSYGREKKSAAQIRYFDQDIQGSQIKFGLLGSEYTAVSSYIGVHNCENLVAAILACAALGVDITNLLMAAANLPQVPGRLESVGNREIGVYVDYAHTPDALSHVLKTLRPITAKKLWVVFGCGGDRDRGKRPQMAKVASELADKVVITSDNPRTEDPLSIIKEIASGASSYEAIESDRRKAIELALAGASNGDVVLIAGKGHEDYQIIGHTKYPFSDQDEVRKILR